jgi:hypothetical protein
VDSPCFAAYFGAGAASLTQFTQRSCCGHAGQCFMVFSACPTLGWCARGRNAPFGGVPAPVLVAAQNASGSKLLRWPDNPARGGAPPMGICGSKGFHSIHLTVPRLTQITQYQPNSSKLPR